MSTFTGPKRKSIKARMLAIALIPSLALLLVGLGVSGYLVNQGIQTYRWADNLRTTVAPGTGIVTDLQLERWLSLVKVGGGTVDENQLAAQRGKVDKEILALNAHLPAMPALNEIVPARNQPGSPWNQLPSVRDEVDSGRISLLDTYDYYDRLLAPIAGYITTLADQAPSAAITDAQLTAADMYGATEDVARANALAFGAAFRGGLTSAEFAEYSRQVGASQSALEAIAPHLTPAEQRQYAALVASPAWQQLTSVQNTLSSTGPTLASASTAPPLAISKLDWQNDSIQVTARMLELFGSHFQYAANLAADQGRSTLISAIVAGLVIVLAGIVVLIVALRMSNRVVRRLGKLRKDTLDIADEHLPRIVHQLQTSGGAPPEVPTLHHGDDEIGQVAEAFNKAQRTAVDAAVQEAKTRQCANSVFLNIAHRSQLVAQRQLSVLDLAERRQEDPQQVQFLFQLDHLATRARRNAENLIILGGGRPARQWRDAIGVRDVVRSAIGETEHFARIRIMRLPEVAIAGPAVGDVVHLLAELLDNATAFAPPEARAEVTGNLVGTGAVLEIEDQGLGISADTRAALNAHLQAPPDYGVLTLRDDSRLGLFVVSVLAARHGVRVQLTESIYGGTRAVVLLPASLLDSTAPPAVDAPQWPAMEPAEDIGSPVTEEFAPVPVTVGAPSGNGSTGQPPPLPRRRRQASLAPQLTSLPAAPARDTEPAERVRDAISAFQRGTHEARELDGGEN